MGHVTKAVTNPSPSAGADLKEREQMSEAEVEIFVQRLRGLMNEIGEGLEVGWRRAFRGPADPRATPPAILSRKDSFCCKLCGKTEDSPRGNGHKGFYEEEGEEEVQRVFPSEGALALSFCVLLVLIPHPSTLRVQAQLLHRSQISPKMLSGFDNFCSFCLEFPSLAT